MSLKLHLLSVFRGLFFTHHRSLEFRAKIFASILLVKKKIVPNDYEKIVLIGKEIYPNDEKRSEILSVLTKEYVEKSIILKQYTLDELLKDIDRKIKLTPRYAKKIDFSHLRRLISDDEYEALLQQRVYEFLVYEVKLYV